MPESLKMTTSLIDSQSDSSEEEVNEGEEDDLLLPRMPSQAGRKGLLSMNKTIYALTFLSAVGGFLFG